MKNMSKGFKFFVGFLVAVSVVLLFLGPFMTDFVNWISTSFSFEFVVALGLFTVFLVFLVFPVVALGLFLFSRKNQDKEGDQSPQEKK